MNESTKTTAFVIAAALMVVAAVASHFANRPRIASDFELVGQPFYADFVSSDQAAALEVIAVDSETAKMRRFKVAKKDGLYRIPSHEDYPAEAAARLASTASSIIGLERESLAGRRSSDHAKLGVLDPESDEIDDPEAVGQRVRLLNEDGEATVDYVIGKEAGDVVLTGDNQPFQGAGDQQKYYYVRRKDEDQTYKVPLDLDLSTKFSDWIDPDLLRFETSDLGEIVIRNYSLEEEPGGNPLMPRGLVKRVGDTLELNKSEANAWQLAGVDDATETFDSNGVTSMISALEELQIADVRRKSSFKGKQLLTPDLKLNRDPELMKSPQEFGRAIQQLQGELEDKGFSLAGSAEQLELVSENGEIEFGTIDGARYTLHVGAPFDGDDQEIKVSGASDEPSEETDDADSQGDEDSDKNDVDAKSRYMLIRVEFDETLLPNKPEQPVEPKEPTKPEGYAPAPEPEESEGDETQADTETDADEPASDAGEEAESDEKAEDASDDKPKRSVRFEEYDILMREYETGQNRFRAGQNAIRRRYRRFCQANRGWPESCQGVE